MASEVDPLIALFEPAPKPEAPPPSLDHQFEEWAKSFHLATHYKAIEAEYERLADLCDDAGCAEAADPVNAKLIMRQWRHIDDLVERHPHESHWQEWVPDNYGDADLDSLGHEQDRLRAWTAKVNAGLGHNGRNLQLLGGVGTGKTWSAYAVIEELACLGNACLPLGKVVRATWTISGGPTGEILHGLRNKTLTFESLVNPGLLLLDDIGAESWHPTMRDRLFAIVNARVAQGKSHIITSNLTPSRLARAIGERTLDRLNQDATRIVFSGPSRRQLANDI